MTANAEDDPLSSVKAMPSMLGQNTTEDLWMGPKLGSELALETLLHELATERGVHAETLMACCGILMGQSAQASLRAEAREKGLAGVTGLQVVRCQDDTSYLFGDPLNRRLIEGHGSPWGVLSEAARQEGCESLPEPEILLLDGIRRLCTPAFGRPQVPTGHAPQDLTGPEQANLWLQIYPLCRMCCSDPGEWPLLCSLLAVRALRLVKPHLPPWLAWRLAMDAAIDAAKVPLAETALADRVGDTGWNG